MAMYVNCDGCACVKRQNFLTKWITQLQTIEEDSTGVKLVRLRMSVYTFVLKPVRLLFHTSTCFEHMCSKHVEV